VLTPYGAAFLELKRSGVMPWQPYVNDAANYLLMRSLTKKVAVGIDFTIRYDLEKPTELDVHTILGISRDVIPGFSEKIVCENASEVIKEMMKLLRDRNIRAYGSNKSRKKN